MISPFNSSSFCLFINSMSSLLFTSVISVKASVPVFSSSSDTKILALTRYFFTRLQKATRCSWAIGGPVSLVVTLNCGNLDDMLIEHTETPTLLRSVLFPPVLKKMLSGMGSRKERRVGVASSHPRPFSLRELVWGQRQGVRLRCLLYRVSAPSLDAQSLDRCQYNWPKVSPAPKLAFEACFYEVCPNQYASPLHNAVEMSNPGTVSWC